MWNMKGGDESYRDGNEGNGLERDVAPWNVTGGDESDQYGKKRNVQMYWKILYNKMLRSKVLIQGEDKDEEEEE